MENEFYTVASFEYTADAQIIKGKLMSEGIEVFLRDEHTIDVDPMVSHAIGGVKVEVHIKDKEKAISIYNEVREYEKDAQGNPLVCRNCNEKRMIIAPLSKSFIYMLFPFFEKKKYQCNNCGQIA